MVNMIWQSLFHGDWILVYNCTFETRIKAMKQVFSFKGEDFYEKCMNMLHCSWSSLILVYVTLHLYLLGIGLGQSTFTQFLSRSTYIHMTLVWVNLHLFSFVYLNLHILTFCLGKWVNFNLLSISVGQPTFAWNWSWPSCIGLGNCIFTQLHIDANKKFLRFVLFYCWGFVCLPHTLLTMKKKWYQAKN
jgi:hypothetical protein